MKSGQYLRSVRTILPEGALPYLERAFAGDALAARRLMIMAPKRMRGHIACLAYHLKVGNPAYREIVKAVWARDSRHFLTGFWRPQMVRRMLARADFKIPEFSGPVTIFRPVSASTTRKASDELCWWLSRSAAIADAAKAGIEDARILQATVQPADIIYWSDRHGEQEVVCGRPINALAVKESGHARSSPATPRETRAGRAAR
jgi:hypothetical protein